MVLVIAVTITAYFVLDLLLQSRGTERQTLIGLELPDTLDQTMIAVEAGLGFECPARPPEVVKEFVRSSSESSPLPYARVLMFLGPSQPGAPNPV
jgi:hypothetical protein